jgi:tetratricopeptide (TPR) repeat protein
MLSDLRWEHGFWSGAERDALRAEAVSRAIDPDKRIVAMAETARCLAMLERDLGQADALLLEANALARRLGREPNALADAGGLLQSHQGRFDDAAALFRRARIVAQRDGERTSEFLALEHLIDIELMRKHYVAAEALAAEMVRLADKIRAGSEGPFARALEALCRAARNDPRAEADFGKALAELRVADAKHRLSLALRVAAAVDLADGRLDRAAERAGEALTYARALDRPSDIALARTLLAAVAVARGDERGRDEQVAALEAEIARPVSDHARLQAEAVIAMTAGVVAPAVARAAA